MSGDDVGGTPRRRLIVGGLLAGGTIAALAVAFAGAPREHAPLPAIARYAMSVAIPRWRLLEPVNEVVYGTRGFDTFGETFLLLAAVVSVVVLSRHREPRRGYFGEAVEGRREQRGIDPAEPTDRTERVARGAERAENDENDDEDEGGQYGGAEHRGAKNARHTGADDEPAERPATPDAEPLGQHGPETADGMTVVVRTAVRIALPILVVAGCYLVAWGYSPGGGFPAGAVLLGAALLVYAAYGHRRVARVVNPRVLETVEMGGAGLIIVTELLGLLLKGSFSANWLPLAAPGQIRSGGVAQLFSAGELVEVGTGLTIAVFALLGMGHDWTPDTTADGDTTADSDATADSGDNEHDGDNEPRGGRRASGRTRSRTRARQRRRRA